MTEEEKVEILRDQIERIYRENDKAEKLKAEIRRLGYSPDRRTWED